MHKKKPDTYFNETCIRFSYHFRIKSEHSILIFYFEKSFFLKSLVSTKKS